MTLKRKSGGSQTDITTTLNRKSSGAWVGVDVIRRRLSGAWTTLWRRINIADAYIFHSVGVGTARAGYRLNTSGIAEKREGGTYTTLETWLSTGSASGYEAKVTMTSGSLTAGTVGSWVALSSSEEWRLEQGSVGTSSCSFTVEIRNASSLAVVDSATIDLEVDRF